MGTQLNDLDFELQKNFTDVELEKNDRFPIIMKDFVIKSKQKFEELQVKYTSMEVAYKDVVAYFGEDPNNTKPDEFFGIFKTFIASFEVCLFLLYIFQTYIIVFNSNNIYFAESKK